MFDRVRRGNSAPPEAILTHLETVAFLASVPETGKVLSLTGITDSRMNHWKIVFIVAQSVFTFIGVS